jgi:alanine racemase
MADVLAARVQETLAHPAPDVTGYLFVNLGAIRRNYRKLCAAAPGAETAGVVKANAYGLGVTQVMSALRAEGCETFFVATPNEAVLPPALTEGVTVYVLNGILAGGPEVFRERNIRPVLSSLGEIEEWLSTCRMWGAQRPAAIHIDTGMTRLGLPAEEVRRLAQVAGDLELCLVLSHLACADEPGHAKNEAQLARFHELTALIPTVPASLQNEPGLPPFKELAAYFSPGVPRSLANSAGIMLGPQYHFELTRPGIALYGGRPALSGPNPMEPVAHLYARIVQVRWAERGESVGYGATHTLKRRTKIATVTAGYADGFFRAFSASDVRDGPPGYIGEHRLPLLGRVSMDLTTYDATDVPDELAQRGGFVELMGGRVTADDLAAFAGTISYEVLTSLGHRYARVYVDEYADE